MKIYYRLVVFALWTRAGYAVAQDDFPAQMREAEMLEQQGQYARAENALRAILPKMKEWAADDSRRGILNHRLGSVYYSQGRYSEAERCYLSAIGTWTRRGEDSRRITTLVSLTALYLETGHYGKAGGLRLEAAAAQLETANPNSAELARLFAVLGSLASVQQRYNEAERYLLGSAAIWARLAPVSFHAMQAASNLGVLYHRMGRHGEALGRYENALPIGRAVLGAGHPNLMKLLANMGASQLEVNGPGAAEPFYREAIAIGENSLGMEHPLLGSVLLNYSVVLERAKRKAEAKEARRRAETILKSASRTEGNRYTVDVSDLLPRGKR